MTRYSFAVSVPATALPKNIHTVWERSIAHALAMHFGTGEQIEVTFVGSFTAERDVEKLKEKQ